MSEPRTARTRFRFVLGMPTRKTDFQIWELTMPSCSAFKLAMSSSYLDERLRISPLSPFLVELLRLVDDQLAVGRIDVDLGALQRAGGRPLEVHAGAVVAAAVAGALEFVLRRQPVRRAAEVGADGDDRVHDLFGPHDPDAVFVLPPLVDFSDRVVGHEAGLELLHRLEENVGKHESSQNAGQTAEGGGERGPAEGQDQRK